MAEKFYTLLTNVGKAQIVNAISTGTKVVFAKLQLGDGNGSYYEPLESQTTLRKKVWEGAISNVKIHQTNSKWIVVETTIPGNVGGFMIREAGIVDASGRLLVVAKYPETYKPSADDGTIKDLTIRLIIEAANATAVTLKIDPTAILATKKDLEDLSNRKAEKAHTHNINEIGGVSAVVKSIKVNSAVNADNVKWSGVTGKPATFPPAPHTHDYLPRTGKATDSDKLDGLDSTAFMRAEKGNGVIANDLGVATLLRWKHYGQNHVIFDASNSTTPSGRPCNRITPEQGWDTANCPTLMGWNGHSTYGVKVSNAGWADGAHNSMSVQGFQFRNQNGNLEVLVNGVWLSVGAKQYTVIRQGRVTQGQFFEYRGGVGVLRGLMCISAAFEVFVDDIKVDEINSICQQDASGWNTLQNEIEFKHSIKLVVQQRSNDSLKYFIQTER